MLKFIVSHIYKFVIIAIVSILLIGLNKLWFRIQEINRIYKETYQIIYDSDQYKLLPESATDGLEVTKTKLYFTDKVFTYYYYIFFSFLISLIAVTMIRLIFMYRKRNWNENLLVWCLSAPKAFVNIVVFDKIINCSMPPGME